MSDKKKIDLGEIVSKAMNKETINTGKSKPYITKKENKREDKPQYITKKTSEEIREREMVKKAKGGRVKNTRRMNRLEELGRVDAEKAYTKKGKRNLKAEKRRIIRSLNSRGAAKRGHGAEIK
jgi:hypothetical protein|tara:strand:+ start:155 stop:523 length:369 start_codon:yes stop_codon:yes gene_type:complete